MDKINPVASPQINIHYHHIQRDSLPQQQSQQQQKSSNNKNEILLPLPLDTIKSNPKRHQVNLPIVSSKPTKLPPKDIPLPEPTKEHLALINNGRYSPHGKDFLTSQDYGTVISAVIGMVPVVGGLLGAGFSVLWGKLFSNGGGYITQEEFTAKMEKLWIEIENYVQEQLDAYALNWCQLKFISLKEKGDHYNDLLTVWIGRNHTKQGLVMPQHPWYVKPKQELINLDDANLLASIRSYYMQYRDACEECIVFFSDAKYAHLLYCLLTATMTIYAGLQRDMILQGVAWGFDPALVNGEDFGPNGAVKAVKQVLHEKITAFHKLIAFICPKGSVVPDGLPLIGYETIGRINELDYVQYPDATKIVSPSSYTVLLDSPPPISSDPMKNIIYKKFKLSLNDFNLQGDPALRAGWWYDHVAGGYGVLSPLTMDNWLPGGQTMTMNFRFTNPNNYPRWLRFKLKYDVSAYIRMDQTLRLRWGGFNFAEQHIGQFDITEYCPTTSYLYWRYYLGETKQCGYYVSPFFNAPEFLPGDFSQGSIQFASGPNCWTTPMISCEIEVFYINPTSML